MDQFAASYLSELTASLSAGLITGLSSKLKHSLQGGEQRVALDRALEMGVIALVAIGFSLVFTRGGRATVPHGSAGLGLAGFMHLSRESPFAGAALTLEFGRLRN